ncbi:MAG: cytidine deaminase [Tolumonas sp.]|jgi:cytidine deaminase|uniref:cytidine deaminase n=1 Tax=Tolumonas auensis TaxID=43948 RepID=UPI001B779FBF|nr:cytidine deaminase [Tolumonas auensis]MBP7980780.1 cytidine deaminase [Tolumonas sp.]
MPQIDDTQLTQLMDAAKASIRHAYMPYSNYPVGAAVLTADNRIIAGVNIENAAYPAGTCAERVALGNAISQGYTQFKAVAVFSPKGEISPCGVCRQFISEFGPDIQILFHWQGQLQQMPIKDLLPFSFSQTQLNA